MIKIKIGDIFQSDKDVLVNTINCVGVMGKGIAKTFKDKFPDLFIDYKNRCDKNLVKPGTPYLFEHKDFFRTQKIINFPTKNHWRSPSKLTYIINGLDIFIKNYQEWNVKSIAFPPLGCGNGGLNWSDVGKIMYQKLVNLEIEIEIYAPYGTPKNQLTTKFLSTKYDFSDTEIRGKSINKIKAEWIPVIECLYQMQKNAYSPKVGRIKFQKIAYILTALDINTGFDFRQGTYGPFSDDIKEMIHIFSNSNIIREEQCGSMNQLIVNNEYETLKEKYIDIINLHQKKINKTADLFERIRTTEKAEEVTSIIFVLKKLKTQNTHINDKDILDSLLEWKNRWNNEKKIISLVVSIRNLAILRWINISFSNELNDIEIY